MGRRNRERVARIKVGQETAISAMAKASGNHTKEQLMICGKCHRIVPESRVTEHLLRCQPFGIICDKCRTHVSSLEFLEHYKNCKAVVMANANPERVS